MAARKKSDREVEDLMEEGFGSPQPVRPKVTVARRAARGEVPEGVPFQPPLPGPPPSEFPLSRNRITREQSESFARKYSIDPRIYRVFVQPLPGKMSLHHVPIPLAHFELGFHLPVDPAFADFLIFARVQPGQVHPNTVRTMFCLICLCRRLGFELTDNILSMFFSSLRMADNILSIRPRKNRVLLFDSPPNKVEFKERWMMIESRIGFPFRPCVNENFQWPQIQYPSTLNHSEKSFLEIITRDLGDDRRKQTRVYSSVGLLSESSLRWCGIGPGLSERKKELGFAKEEPNEDWTIHPGGVFSYQCDACSLGRGCRTGKGIVHILVFLAFYFTLVMTFCSIYRSNHV